MRFAPNVRLTPAWVNRSARMGADRSMCDRHEEQCDQKLLLGGEGVEKCFGCLFAEVPEGLETCAAAKFWHG